MKGITRERHIIGHIASDGPIHNISIWLPFRCYRSNVSTIALNVEFNSVSMMVPSNTRITKDLCSLFTSVWDSICKNAEQFSFRNVGDDSRSNISFRASLG